ncbi:MAG: hypothetical protein ACE5FS_04910 [Paracoccaceae bacterium]
MKRWIVFFVACTVLAGCAFKMPNIPFLGIGDDAKKSKAAVVDPTQLLPDVTDAKLEPVADGMILRATGIAPRQGYHGASLVAVGAEGSTIRFQIRAIPPAFATPQGPPRSRRLLVARVLSFKEMKGIRTIEIISGNRKLRLRGR